MQNKSHYNLFYKICASALIILHLVTFGPIREALAFYAESSHYKLTSGILNEGGRDRNTGYYTKLLLHADGADGSTIFKDETGKSIITQGNAQIDTGQSKFGGASGLFDGSSYLNLPDSADWDFGSGDFTIDCWVRFNAFPASGYIAPIASQRTDSAHYWYMGLFNNGTYEWRLNCSIAGGDLNIAQPADVSLNTWYHIAFVRSANNWMVFQDGVQVGTTILDSNPMPDVASILKVGAAGTGHFHNGWIDEFRISKGIARWTDKFTLPTQPDTLNNDSIFNSPNLWQDTLAEPAIGKSYSANYVLSAGFIPTVQSNPPVLLRAIPYQTWQMNTNKDNAFDLDDYFSSPDGYPLTFTVSGNSKINVSIDPATHVVSFSPAKDWFGTEKVYFTATDSEGGSAQSNKVALQVENTLAPDSPNNPLIVGAEISPVLIQEGDLVTITVKALDLDNDDLAFTYSEFFTQTRAWKEGGIWYSQATWQTPAKSKGHYNIKITAKDTVNLTDTETVTINVGTFNHPPVLSPIADITAQEGDLVVITPQATDSDNDALSFYYSAPFDVQGKWLTGYEDAGTHIIQVTVSDGIDTASQDAKVIINNTNRAPEVSLTLSKYTVVPSEVIGITLSASDPDGDTITFSLKKDGSEIASGNIASTYIATTSFSGIGDHTISATVTDSGNLSTTASRGVDVTDPNANRDSINPVMGDFNGDALSDLGLYNSDTGLWEICLSDKGVFRNAEDWLTLSSEFRSRDWWPMGGDFNGDAKSDAAVYNNTNGKLEIALSNGSGFASPNKWLTFSGASYSWQPFTGNFNGDKYNDFALYNKDTGEVKVALGTGTGLASLNTWLTGFGNDYAAMGGDFNADGLTDLCLFKKSSGEFKVAFSNTKAFVDGASWISGFATDKDVLISDFNNDGLTDIGYWDKANKWYYALSSGSAFIDKGLWLDSFGTASDESATTGDFDGNGISDAACFDRDARGIDRWATRLSQNKPADLLTEIDNGIGGKTKVTYTYTAVGGDNPDLPFPVYVASAISLINDFPVDRTATYTQNFSFCGGYYDATEREFRGFAKVKVSDPITDNYTDTYFYQGRPGQDAALKGQIEKIIAYDGNKRIISQTINTYDVRKAGPGGDRVLGFPALIGQVTSVWEENATYITTQDKFTYDNIGNLIEQRQEGIAGTNIPATPVAGDEKSTSITYSQAYENGFNRPLETTLKDKDASIVSKKNFEYDNRGNLSKDIVEIFNPITQERNNAITQYTYDSFGNLTSTTNSLGSIVTTDYETAFYTYPEKVTNSLGHIIRYVYEPKFGTVKSVTDANGVTSSTDYDSLGRVVQIKNGLNQVTATYSYPDFNTRVTVKKAPLGDLTSSEYIDGLGRKYKTVSSGEDGISSRNIATEAFYNNRGLSERESLPHYVNEDPAQIAYVKYEYDIRGRVKKTISDFPGTGKDAEALVNYINPLYTETTDPMGHRKGALKDVYGNIIEITEFTQGGIYTTKYEYDTQNNLLKTTDSKNNVTQVFYDSLNRKVKMLDPDMGTWTYEYDLVGNLIKQTDAKGQVLEFTYDALNRLTAKRYPLSANPAVEYFYDDATKDNCIGRLSKITDQSGSTEFFYDNLGREIKSVKTVGSSQYVVVREYDSLDRLTTLTYPDAEVVNYAYDANSGLLEKVYSSTTEYIKDLAYNAKGQIREIDCGNNTKTTYTYGQDLRLSRILTTNDQRLTTLQDLNYIFDKNGNLTTLTDSLKNNIRTYAYDDLDRLTEALNLPAPGGGYTDFYYQYDSIGNMTYKSDIGQMAYGQNAGPHALTSAGGYNYQYDANGNMTVGKNKTLIYDAENRLLEVNESGVIASFLYDGDGGRVMKGLSPTGTVPEQWTLYIGSLFEKDSDGTTRKHIFAGANRVATKGLSTEGGLSLNYFHSDHLGSSNVITDSSGAQVEYCEYTPYGSFSRHTTQDPGRTRHYFTGKELDNTGLYFYGARYYDPGLGRFITADTIVQAPYDPQSLNRYSYCRNNPLKYVDPTGHFWWFIPLIIGAIIGAVSAGVQSDWNIKAMLVGAAIGGVSGVVGFGAAGVTSQILGRVGSAMFGGMVGGATAGLLNSAYYGGDILRGTLMGAGIGALGGLAFGVLSQIDVTGLVSGFTKVSLYAAAGGGLSKLGGGEFWQGAALAGAVAMSEIVYKGVLSTDKNGRKNSNPSMKTATGDAKPKLNEDETIVIHNDGSTEVGTGFGPRAKSGLFGLGRLIQEDAAWTQWIAKNVPGINGTALFHDILTHFYSSTPIGFTNGLIFNVPSMPPAFAITALGSAAAAEFSPILGQFVVYGNDDK